MALHELPTRQLDELVSYSKVSVQRQETCSNRKNTIQIKLRKTSLEREPYSSNRDSMSRKISDRDTEKLGISDKGNGRSIEKYEKAV